jgi:hypothetical protein
MWPGLKSLADYKIRTIFAPMRMGWITTLSLGLTGLIVLAFAMGWM